MRFIQAFPDGSGNCCEDEARDTPCEPCAGCDFTFEQPDCSVPTIDFSTEDGMSWDWDFGDGSEHSTEQNPTHEYADFGTYTVTLTIDDGECTKEHEITLLDPCDGPPYLNALVIYSQEAADIGVAVNDFPANEAHYDPTLLSGDFGYTWENTFGLIQVFSGSVSVQNPKAIVIISGVLGANPFTIRYKKSDGNDDCPIGEYELYFNGTDPLTAVPDTLNVTCSL